MCIYIYIYIFKRLPKKCIRTLRGDIYVLKITNKTNPILNHRYIFHK